MGNKLVHIVIFLGYFLTVGIMFGISAYVMLQGITGWGWLLFVALLLASTISPNIEIDKNEA